MKRLAVAGILALAVLIVRSAGLQSRAIGLQSRVQFSNPAARLHVAVDPAIESLWAAYDARAALGHVQFISQYWRLAGNAGYDASLDRIAERLKTSGVVSGGSTTETTPDVGFDAYANTARGWDHTVGTLAIVRSGQPDDIVLSREKERLALCINSFSTVPGGVVAPLVDVGRGDRDEDYAGKDVRGAIVLGDADAGQLWRRAVVTNGAVGVVSTALPAYLNADPPTAKPTPRDQWDILQWSSIPYDEARKGFGFKASPRAAARLRAAVRRAGRSAGLQSGVSVSVRVTIASSFSTNPVRTLIAEIPGRVAPDERIVMAAHVQEPGANDNASGVATLAELAVAMASGIRQGKFAPPGRTLTFLFLNEISGSRQWVQDHPEEAKRVKYMFSLDMTGEDVAKTGGSFLIERYPDPGAVWDRPWDPHSEWGRGNVRAEQLKGDLINDVHLAICRRVARKSTWIVKTNPYEGGSDHTVFSSAGVPSVLDWHFTDRYYHTNFDTPDKTSPTEMKNVGVAVGATAWLLASANEAQAMDAAELVATAGQARVTLEETEGAKLAAADKDPAAAKAREATIVQAWRKWYAEAVRSVSRLVVGSASPALGQRLERLAAAFETRSATGHGGLAAQVGVAIVPVLALADQAAGQRVRPLQPVLERKSATPLFQCGQDEPLRDTIPLRWETVALAADGRLYSPCPRFGPHQEHRESGERNVLARASLSPQIELRRVAAIAAGRVGALGPLLNLLDDSDPLTRRQAASGIGDALSGTPTEPEHPPIGGFLEVTRPGVSLREKIPIGVAARSALETRLAKDADGEVAGTVLETLGRLRYPTDAERDRIELLLVAQGAVTGAPARVLGAAKGLEALIRGNAKHPIGADTRLRLRELTRVGSTLLPVPTIGGEGTPPAPGDEEKFARTRRLALMALQTARDDDIDTLIQASRDADWQVRRLVALRIDPARAEFRPILEALTRDASFQVRYELLAPMARQSTAAKACLPFTRWFDDLSPAIVLRALDLVPDGCADEDAVVKRLVAWAEDLRLTESSVNWHRPAHAFGALARLDAQAARPLASYAVEHPVWQVRARAATAAGFTGDESAALQLAADREPNVRDAALEALRKLNSPGLFTAAIDALGSEDYQLIRTAANLLKDTPDPLRNDAIKALLETLNRLTAAASDTSRDPRIAMIERLQELLPPERASDILSLNDDFDPKVRAAAGRAFMALTKANDPPVSNPYVRYPSQPAIADFASLPRTVLIKIENLGVVEVELLADQAPVTVTKFVALVREKYYDRLTFHRVVANFVIQGGSRGANEYMGVARYARDELGLQPHVRGAVGISTRGRDTGDMQIFIDLVDIPRLDHEYTVLGRVIRGLDVLDRILEGATIESITVK